MANKIEVTETYDGKDFSLVSPWDAQRSFMVTGVDNQSDACTATDADTGLRIPRVDEPLTPESRVICKGPKARPLGPYVWIVTCPYAIPNDGTFNKSQTDPLNEPWEVEWKTQYLSLPVDLDLDGRPILNSAGDAFSPPTRRVAYKNLTIYRNELFFDESKSEMFENTTNKTAVPLGKRVSPVKPYYMICNSIQPAERVKESATYVKMAYNFDIIRSDDLGKYPWQHAFLDAGNNGWVVKNGKTILGPFVTQPDGAGAAVYQFSQAVRLNGSGKPFVGLYDNVKVGINGQGGETFAGDPVVPPTGIFSFNPLDAERITVSGTGVGFRLYYRQFREAEHNNIGL